MELIKHLAAFDPSTVQGNIAVVGVGATGTATALNLAKLGLENIYLFDHDSVEDHNLPNQTLYGPEDVGVLKVKCAAKRIKQLTGYTPKFEAKKLETKNQLVSNNISTVFICVDTMAARKEIFEKCVFLNGRTNFLVDMRMTAFSGQTILAEVNRLDQCKYYRSTLYSDDDVAQEVGGCRITISVGATASLTASYSVLLWMKRLRQEDKDSFEWKYNIVPPMLISTTGKQMGDYLEELEDEAA